MAPRGTPRPGAPPPTGTRPAPPWLRAASGVVVIAGMLALGHVLGLFAGFLGGVLARDSGRQGPVALTFYVATLVACGVAGLVGAARTWRGPGA